jgi:hypothetical protein
MFRRHTNSINSLFFSTQLHKQKGKCLKLLPSPSPPPQKKRFVLVDRGQRKHLGWMHQLILVPHLSQVPRMVSMHYRALWIYKFLEITKQTLASVKLRVFYVAVAPTMLISSWVPMAEDAFSNLESLPALIPFITLSTCTSYTKHLHDKIDLGSIVSSLSQRCS